MARRHQSRTQSDRVGPGWHVDPPQTGTGTDVESAASRLQEPGQEPWNVARPLQLHSLSAAIYRGGDFQSAKHAAADRLMSRCFLLLTSWQMDYLFKQIQADGSLNPSTAVTLNPPPESCRLWQSSPAVRLSRGQNIYEYS